MHREGFWANLRIQPLLVHVPTPGDATASQVKHVPKDTVAWMHCQTSARPVPYTYPSHTLKSHMFKDTCPALDHSSQYVLSAWKMCKGYKVNTFSTMQLVWHT